MSPTVLNSRPFEMPEAVWEDVEDFTETLDCMNPWHEPDGYFAYDDNSYIPDQADAYSHLEL